VGIEARDPSRRLDARQSGARRADPRLPCRRSSRGVRCDAQVDLTDDQLAEIEGELPLGFAARERDSEPEWFGIQKY
jgi:hypothetical protein